MTESCKHHGLPCYYCGVIMGKRKAKKPTRDHVVPKFKGGTNKNSNIVWCCLDCNRSKGSLTLDEFRAVLAVRNGWVIPFMFAGEPCQ